MSERIGINRDAAHGCMSPNSRDKNIGLITANPNSLVFAWRAVIADTNVVTASEEDSATITDANVVVAGDIVIERTRADGGIIAAIPIAGERRTAKRGVIAAVRIGLKGAAAEGGVITAVGI